MRAGQDLSVLGSQLDVGGNLLAQADQNLTIGTTQKTWVQHSATAQTKATFLGQVNDWKDPVTNAKTFVGAVGSDSISGQLQPLIWEYWPSLK